MTPLILRDWASYTFSDYFALPNPTREVVAAFEYDFQFIQLSLSKSPVAFDP